MVDINKSVPNNSCIFKGDKYRITILTERLVRLEYSEDGMFLDLPTSVIWYRNLDKPEFEVSDGKTILKIETSYFILEYRKEKKFKGSKLNPSKNLRIELKSTGKYWYYNHPEIRNYYSCSYKSRSDDKPHHIKSLYSEDGFVSLDDSTSSIIMPDGSYQKRNKCIDTYVFMYGDDFYKCLNDYFDITGRPSMIPRIALGNWWSKDKTYKELELPKLVSKFERENVPISIFLLDNWYKDNNFNINSYYKDPTALIDYLKQKNILVGLELEELKFIDKENANYNLFKDMPSDKSGNIPFNVYNKDILNIYLNSIINPLKNIGINLFNVNYIKKDLTELQIIKDSLLDNNKRDLMCAYYTPSAHRYSIVYAGDEKVDFKSLKNILEFNVNASNIGMSFFAHDFGGTLGGIEDNELFIRFIQLGVFSPILKLGSSGGKYYKREPWKWEIKTDEITSQFLRLRYKLIPYIYTESYKYYKYGKPLIEPLYYRYPMYYDDDMYKYEYFFGNSIFICPITEKKNDIMNRVIKKLFIPHGTWYDYTTGKKFYGNKKYISFYKDEEYPIFVKAGSIIPMSLNKYNDTSTPEKMEIQIFPGESNTYSIYEDDGITNEYKKDNYLITNIEFIFNKGIYKLTVLPVLGKKGIISKNRDYRFVFRNTKFPSIVQSYMDGKPIINNCFTDGNDFILEVNDVDTTSQLTILLNAKDLEVDSMRIINDDIVSIISDLPIDTDIKQIIDDIIFGNLDIKKKRIELRKLAYRKKPLDKKYIKLFLNLLEYIEKV